MKQFSHIILALILCSLIWSCRSNHAFSSFYKENKDDIQVHINAPKWLTLLFVPSDEKAEIKRFSKGIRKVKLMMSETHRDGLIGPPNKAVSYALVKFWVEG